jgi:tetratricopeptide (TPR) repeat protein
LCGLELGRLGRPGDAEPEFRAASRLMPDLVEARLNLGISLYQQGKLDAAKAEFSDVLQRNPTNAMALRYVREIGSQSSGTKVK